MIDADRTDKSYVSDFTTLMHTTYNVILFNYVLEMESKTYIHTYRDDL